MNPPIILDTELLEPLTCSNCFGSIAPGTALVLVAYGQLKGSAQDPIEFFHPECAPLGSEHKPNPGAVLNHPWPLMP